MKNKKLSILGCGWFGLPMAKHLVKNGYIVKGSTTKQEKFTELTTAGIEPFLIDAANAPLNDAFFDCAILIICIPPKRNTLELAYPSKIKNIAATAEKNLVKQVILISSTGVYQNDNFKVDESILPQPNTAAGKAIFEAEQILSNSFVFTTTIIRFAGLIGPERNLARHFAGKTEIANGLAPINLIHLNDCIGITQLIIEQKAFGQIYHGVTPSHPTRQDFYTKACLASGFEKPIFKDECLDWKQVESKNVPEVLAYEYVFNNWDKYFDELSQ